MLGMHGRAEGGGTPQGDSGSCSDTAQLPLTEFDLSTGIFDNMEYPSTAIDSAYTLFMLDDCIKEMLQGNERELIKYTELLPSDNTEHNSCFYEDITPYNSVETDQVDDESLLYEPITDYNPEILEVKQADIDSVFENSRKLDVEQLYDNTVSENSNKSAVNQLYNESVTENNKTIIAADIYSVFDNNNKTIDDILKPEQQEINLETSEINTTGVHVMLENSNKQQEVDTIYDNSVSGNINKTTDKIPRTRLQKRNLDAKQKYNKNTVAKRQTRSCKPKNTRQKTTKTKLTSEEKRLITKKQAKYYIPETKELTIKLKPLNDDEYSLVTSEKRPIITNRVAKYYIPEPETKELTIKLKPVSDGELKVSETKKPKSSKTKPSKVTEKPFEDFTNYVEKILVDPHKLAELMENDRKSAFFRNIPYKCDKCVEPLPESQVERHAALHNKTVRQKLLCEVCEQCFTNEKSLKTHKTKHTYIRQCLVCGIRMCSRVMMQQHLKCHTIRVQCTDCIAVFPTRLDFHKHYRAAHSVYMCNDCGETRNTKRNLIRHMMKLHNLRRHCKLCNKSFKDYDKHVRISHTKQVTEQAFCVECNKQFINVHAYRYHISTSPVHNKERFQKLRQQRHPCPDCDKVYQSSVALTNHHDFVHKRNSRHKCQHCGQQLLTATRLADHIRVVHLNIKREKNKICNICGRGFSGKSILTHHMRTHTGDRPYQCEHCDARFAQKSAMRSHIKNKHLND